MNSKDTQTSTIEEQLKFELELSKYIMEMSTFFINLPVEKIDEGILTGIRKVCELGKADSVAVALFSEDKSTVSVTHHWNRPGAERDQLRLKATPIADLPWLFSKLLANQTVSFRTAEDLPKEAQKEREAIAVRFIRSGIIVPLSSREGVHGALSIDTIFSERMWHARCAKLLTLMAEMVTGALLYKRNRDQLLHAQKMEVLGQIAGGIAHDFNNSLGPIMGYAELVMNQIKKGPMPNVQELAQRLDSILIAGQRAKDLVQQILTFGRRHQGKNVAFKPAAIVKECLNVLRAAAPANIAIEFNKESTTAVVEGNPIQFYQIVMNLGINGIQAMHSRGGTLTLTLEVIERRNCDLAEKFLAERYVCFSVRDTGLGIPVDIQSHIFEPFFTSKAIGHGTGLGLSVVKTIVQEMAGDVRFTSDARSGTVFYIYIPFCSEAATEVEVPDVDYADLTGNAVVLFVDNETSILNLAEAMLTRLGYEFKGCSSVQSAIETFEANPHRFDLLISELNMPASSGLELAAKIRAVRDDIPIILTTGYEGEDLGVKRPVDAVLAKPFSIPMLGRAVKDALKKGRA